MTHTLRLLSITVSVLLRAAITPTAALTSVTAQLPSTADDRLSNRISDV